MRLALIFFTLVFTVPLLAQGTKADYERAAKLNELFGNKVFRDKVEPNWLNDTTFWYRVDLPQGAKEWVIVDAVAKTRKVISEQELNTLRKGKDAPPKQVRQPNEQPPRRRNVDNAPNPDWSVKLAENNVILINTKTKQETKLTTDGTSNNGYRRVLWAPDGKTFIVIRTKAGSNRLVTLVESSPKDQLQPKTTTLNYTKPGDEINQDRPYLFDVASAKEIPLKNLPLIDNPWSISDWQIPDNKYAYFLFNQRGHRVLRLMRLDLRTGDLLAIANEEPKTFVDYAHKAFHQHIHETNELIWMSERSGWNHLYLIDRLTGQVKNPITQGEWVVRGVDRVDVQKRQLWLRVCGIDPKQDPYHIHHVRVDFDGRQLTRLTDGDGTHTPPKFSPDGKYYVVTWSRVDQAPVTELRQTADGAKLLTLETADISALTKTSWKQPERFVVKGRDGKTDIYGNIYRPSTFDPAKTYPVIEYIYAGPHSHFVPKNFRVTHGFVQPMAELGFIVVQIDGMGTNWRSKAFHDVSWKNLGDSGFPDRILWIKEAAKKYPQMNIKNGVGIFGGSAGGQSSTRAMLAHGDFYSVAVSDCGCHDNRMDKIWWNELWMSYPIDKHYEEQSNVTNAHKLTGKLMLVVGELDKNVDPASTMQVANALIKANKDFDLLIMPSVGHGSAETPYASRRRADFFVRHLLKVEPRAN